MTDLIDSRYRAEFEHSSDPLLVVDCQNGRIVHFNLQALMLLRYPAGTLVETCWDTIRTSSSESEQTPSRETLESGYKPVGICCGDGTQAEVLTRSERIRFFDRDCDLLHIQLADEAIIPAMVSEPALPSEAERIRFESLEAEARWQLLSTEVPGLIYQTCGPTDRIEFRVPYINDRVDDYLGWTPAEIYESPMRLLQGIYPEDWSNYCDAALAAMTGLSPFEIEMRFVSRRTGAVRWFKVCSRPRVLDNGYQLWSGLALDIHDLRSSQASLQTLNRELENRVEQRSQELVQAQAELIELQAKLCRTSRFNLIRQIAAGWAHRVHQPLAAIANYAAVGMRHQNVTSSPDGTLAEVFGEIQREALQAGDLLRQIRSFIAEQFHEPLTHDLSAIVNSALNLARAIFQENNIQFELELPEEVLEVKADENHLIQVLVDLFVNSVEAMASANIEKPRIEIQLRSINDQVELILKDVGPGVPETEAKQIFDEFYTTKPNSLGLGLAMSRAVVESYGGTLSLIPSERQAVFRLLLPRVQTSHSTAANK